MGKFSRRGSYVQPTPPVCKKGPPPAVTAIIISLRADFVIDAGILPFGCQWHPQVDLLQTSPNNWTGVLIDAGVQSIDIDVTNNPSIATVTMEVAYHCVVLALNVTCSHTYNYSLGGNPWPTPFEQMTCMPSWVFIGLQIFDVTP